MHTQRELLSAVTFSCPIRVSLSVQYRTFLCFNSRYILEWVSSVSQHIALPPAEAEKDPGLQVEQAVEAAGRQTGWCVSITLGQKTPDVFGNSKQAQRFFCCKEA